MMVLRDTSAYSSENSSRLPALSSGISIIVFKVKLYRSCHTS